MTVQFISGDNPNMPEQGTYIYHARKPRFLAKIVESGLEIVDKIDGEDVDYSGKLNRAWKWYQSTQKRVR